MRLSTSLHMNTSLASKNWSRNWTADMKSGAAAAKQRATTIQREVWQWPQPAQATLGANVVAPAAHLPCPPKGRHPCTFPVRTRKGAPAQESMVTAQQRLVVNAKQRTQRVPACVVRARRRATAVSVDAVPATQACSITHAPQGDEGQVESCGTPHRLIQRLLQLAPSGQRARHDAGAARAHWSQSHRSGRLAIAPAVGRHALRACWNGWYALGGRATRCGAAKWCCTAVVMRCWHRLPLQGPPAVQPLHAAAPAPLAFHRAPCTSRTSLRQHITPTTAVARAAASGSEVGPAAGQQIAGARADADSSDDEYMEHSLPTALLGEDEEQLEQLEQLGSASWDEDAASHPTPRSGRGRRHQSPAPRVSGSALSQELSRRITSSETVVQLLDAVQLHGEHADDDAVAAAFQQVAKLVTALPPRTAGSDAAQPAESLVPVQQLLRLLLPRLEACAHSMGLSSLTQVMWACSKLQRCTSLLEPLVAPGLQAVLTQLLQRGVGASSGPPGSRKAAGGPLQVRLRCCDPDQTLGASGARGHAQAQLCAWVRGCAHRCL